MKLQTLKEAMKSRNEVMQNIEVVRSDLEHMKKVSRFNSTHEQRKFCDFLENSLCNLSKELLSIELTIAEIQWYGEGSTA